MYEALRMHDLQPSDDVSHNNYSIFESIYFVLLQGHIFAEIAAHTILQKYVDELCSLFPLIESHNILTLQLFHNFDLLIEIAKFIIQIFLRHLFQSVLVVAEMGYEHDIAESACP